MLQLRLKGFPSNFEGVSRVYERSLKDGCQGSFNGVWGSFKDFQGGFKGILRMLWGSFKGVPWKFLGCFKEDWRVFQWGFKCASRVLKEVEWVFVGSFQCVSIMFQGSF